MMNDWIEINLPWYNLSEDRDPPYEEYPDHSVQIAEMLGEVQTEYEKLEELLKEYDNPFSTEFLRLKYELQDSGVVEDIEGALKALHNPAVDKVLRLREIRGQISDWEDSHPDNIAVAQRNALIHEEFKKWQGTVSFTYNKLCQPGTLLECESTDGKTFQLLIGSINRAGGICNDCRGIQDDTIVKRCLVVWSPENKEKERSES